MTKRDLLRRVSPIVLSAAVALTSMPSAVLAADFTDSAEVVEEAAAETEEATEEAAPAAEAEEEFASDETAEAEASVEAEVSEEAADITAETEEAVVEEEVPVAEEEATEEATEETVELFSDAEEEFADAVGETEYVYGTVNLSYADYFYGELNNVKEDATMDLTATDKAAALREDGMYDTITCATNSKSMRYGTAWGQSNEDGTAELYGIKDVNIAVPTTLYEEATAAIAAGSTCNNKLLEIVGNMTVSATETAPAEYKVLNGDGTLTAMKTETKTDELWTATISTDTVWGDYLVVGDLGDSQSSVTTSNLLGIVVETSDGAKYGMLHSQNTWLKTYEFAFAVTEGFVEPHGNTIDYQRFADMQGKTITKITYLLEDSADLVINTSLLCKKQLEDTQTITGTANGAYTSEGTTVQMTRTGLPESSAYALDSVEFNGNVLTEGTDYTYDAGTDILTIKNTTSTSAGTYSLTYTDATYKDIYTDVEVSSGLEEGDVKIENNVLIVNSDLYTVADYLAAVTATTLDGKALSAGKRSAANAAALAVFDKSTGEVNFEAQLNEDNVFKKGDGGVYEIELTSTAFPGVSGTLTDDFYAGLTSAVTEAKALSEADYTSETWTAFKKALEECESMIAASSDYTRSELEAKIASLNEAKGKLVKAEFVLSDTAVTLYTEGTTSAILKVTTNETGTVAWTSSDANVASVDANGTVTAKAAGTATITASLNGKSATCTVTVKVPGITVKAKDSTIYTKGAKKTTITVEMDGVTGTPKFTSSNKKIATVNKNGVVKAKKKGTVKITVKVGKYSKTIKIKVKKPTLKLSKKSATLSKGKTVKIKAKANSKKKITYKSSNKKVATVNKNGKVTAKGKGTAKITVKCNGVKKTFTVTVK